jgi:DNA-binding NtrC family response regulator
MPFRVLVIDDEQDMRDELVALLQDYGFGVETAQNGEEGLQKLRTNEFDVAIVDLRMPKMNGLTLIRHIDQENIDTYVIILTGHGDKEDAIAAIKLQRTVRDWFEKSSLNAEELAKRVKRLAEGLSFDELAEIFSEVAKTDPEYVR